MVHRALHSNAISRLKVWMWDITTVNLKSHPEIKINGLYFNWKLQLLWASEKSKMVVSLIEFHFEFLLPELESVSIFIFVSKYHVSIFLPIYLAGKIPFFLRQIHEKIIVPQIARKDVFAFRPFTLHWQNSKSSFFGTWSTNSADCKSAKKIGKRIVSFCIGYSWYSKKRKVSPLVSSDIQMSKMDFIEWAQRTFLFKMKFDSYPTPPQKNLINKTLNKVSNGISYFHFKN